MKAFWVTKRLAFGSAITTWRHVEQLQTLGITHIVNLRHGKHGKKVKQFKNLWLPFRDDMKPRPKWFYRSALRFYVKAMQQARLQSLCDVSSRNLPQCIADLLFSAALTGKARNNRKLLCSRRGLVPSLFRPTASLAKHSCFETKQQLGTNRFFAATNEDTRFSSCPSYVEIFF